MKSCLFVQSPPIVALGDLVVPQLPLDGVVPLFAGGLMWWPSINFVNRINALNRALTSSNNGGAYTNSAAQCGYACDMGTGQMGVYGVYNGGIGANLFQINRAAFTWAGPVVAPYPTGQGFRYDTVFNKIMSGDSLSGSCRYDADGLNPEAVAGAGPGCAQDATNYYVSSGNAVYKVVKGTWAATVAIAGYTAANVATGNQNYYSDGTFLWMSSRVNNHSSVIRITIADGTVTTFENTSAPNGSYAYEQILPLGDGRFVCFGDSLNANMALVIFNPSDGSFYSKRTGLASGASAAGALCIDSTNRIIAVAACGGTLMKFYGY